MRVLIDTNVLLRAVQRMHPASPVAASALKNLRWRADEPCLTPQNIIEFWNVCTRPVDSNGLGLTAGAADLHVTGFEHLFTILPDSMQIFREWRRLVLQYNVTGVSVHDARLVAAMSVHAIDTIVTFDANDFSRYKAINVLHPQTLG